jgi:hypothetical protein
MRKFLPLTIALLAPVAAAQNCFDGDWGTLLATSPADVVLPIQPIGFAFPIGGTTYTDVHITDHGYVQLSNAGVPAPAGTPAIYTPTTANLVAGSAKVCALYADIVGTGGGEIWFSSSATKCVITWRNMQNFGLPNNRFSLQLILFPNGDFRTVFGPGVTNNSTFTVPSDNGIIGASPGGGATLPVASDISAGGSTTDDTTYEAWTVPMTFDLPNNSVLFIKNAAGPGYTFVALGAPANCASTTNVGTGCDGMAMTGVGLPSIGNSNFTLRISGVPAVSPIALVAFGTTSLPGVPLDPIGMAGCSGYQNTDIGIFTAGPVVSGVSDFVLSVPLNTSLVGATLASQGVALSLLTTLGLAVSGGTDLTLGYGAN